MNCSENSQINKQKYKMSEDHECGERPCNVGKYSGAYLLCSRCSKKYYGECLDQKKEVVQLLNALKNCNQHGTPSGLQVKIKAILHSESLFEFICVKCKTEGNPYDIINRLKAEAQKIMMAKDQEYSQLMEKYKDTEKTTNELIEKIVILESGNLNTEMQVDQNEDNKDGTNEISMEISRQNKKLLENINDNMMIMSSDIEARIKLEFEKLQQAIQKQMNAPEQDRKRKKATNGNNNNIETPNINIQNKDKINKLKPPKIEENEERDIYEIHIARFDIKTTEKDIETFIMDKTKIKYKDTFKVIKIKGRIDDETKNYTAFKVTTLNSDVYKQVINPKIWEPEFTARDYKPKITKYNRFERNEGRTNNNNNARKPAGEDTPRRYGRNGTDIRKRAIINNIQMEDRNRSNETGGRNANSPARNTPRTYNRSGGNLQGYRGSYANMEMQPQFTHWIHPQQVMYYPPNSIQNPNFYIPLNNPNQNITQQKAQQIIQNAQPNPTQ